jgi:hypothetical protein
MGVKLGLLFLSEEHRLRVSENRVLRKIFGRKRDEVMELGRLHNKELHDLYFVPSVCVGGQVQKEVVVACMYGGEERSVGKPEGKGQLGPLGRPRCRWRIILKFS